MYCLCPICGKLTQRSDKPGVIPGDKPGIVHHAFCSPRCFYQNEQDQIRKELRQMEKRSKEAAEETAESEKEPVEEKSVDTPDFMDNPDFLEIV